MHSHHTETANKRGFSSRVGVWLAVFALVLQAAFAPLHGPRLAFDESGPGITAANEDFCLALSGDSGQDPSNSTNHASAPCIFCSSATSPALAALDGVQVFAPLTLASQSGWALLPIAHPLPARLESGNPRAPPSFT
jgi:hypothetical protein